LNLPLDTFHDVITATWDKAKSALTSKQKKWGEAFLSLDNPTDAQVARKLGISRAASSKMKWRLLGKLRPYYKQYLIEKGNDDLLLKIAMDKEERILKRPEYLEKRRGRDYYVHWKAEKTSCKRLGLKYFSGRIGRQIIPQEFEQLKHWPIIKSTTHKASPLSIWWKEKAQQYASQKNIEYTEAYIELSKFYSKKWPEDAAAADKRCRFCRCLLPIGEIIPESNMGKVTIRRKYCSNYCKTTYKRIR